MVAQQSPVLSKAKSRAWFGRRQPRATRRTRMVCDGKRKNFVLLLAKVLILKRHPLQGFSQAEIHGENAGTVRENITGDWEAVKRTKKLLRLRGAS